MNIVIISGTVVTEVDFKFIYDRYVTDKENAERYKHISVAKFKAKLLNGSVVEVYGYDNIADFMIRKCNKLDKVCIEGRLDSKGKVEIFSLSHFLFYNNSKIYEI